MMNLAMKRKLESGEAKDVSKCSLTPEGDYLLPAGFFEDGKDYCDARKEVWIWSIGRHRTTGEVCASTTAKFYLAPFWECLWLR